MKKLAWIICPNGGGHKYRSERTFNLLKNFLKSKNFELYFWGPGPKTQFFKNEKFHEILKSDNYSWPKYSIKDFKPENFDLIISDNIIENKLGYFLKENESVPFIFLSSFMWEMIDSDYDKNQILWIFDRLNCHFIFNKYFFNEKIIGKPRNFTDHGLTCDNKILQNKFKEGIFKIYITLGLSEIINQEIIERIRFVINNLNKNIKVYSDSNLYKYIKNVEPLDHNKGISIANLIICRPGLGTLNQALCSGIEYFITCPEPENKEMISNENSLIKIVNVKNIYDQNINEFIDSVSKKQKKSQFLEREGFEEIVFSIKNYVNKNFV